jgi:hypothetical protein
LTSLFKAVENLKALLTRFGGDDSHTAGIVSLEVSLYSAQHIRIVVDG